MPRLFTGLEIPESIGLQLSFCRGGLPGARWIDPANYHITLRFIGDVDHATARDVFSLLGEGRSRGSLDITLDGLASFGGDRPRAVFARAVPTDDLAGLQAEQERMLRRIGLPPERRKFTPHVTLAHLRDSSPADVAGVAAGVEGDQERDQPAHDVGVALAAHAENGSVLRRFGAGLEPDLARAAANLVGLRPRRVGQRLHHAAEFDDVAVALVPIVEKLEVRDDLVEGGQHAGTDDGVGTTPHIGANRAPDDPSGADAALQLSGAGRAAAKVEGCSPADPEPRLGLT